MPVLRAVLPTGVIGSRHGRYLALNRFYVGGPAYGGLVGDVLDASRFLRLHLNDGSLDGHRVLSAQSTRAMRVLDQPGKPFDHGIGWFRRPTASAGDWVEHFGSGAGFWNVIAAYQTEASVWRSCRTALRPTTSSLYSRLPPIYVAETSRRFCPTLEWVISETQNRSV